MTFLHVLPDPADATPAPAADLTTAMPAELGIGFHPREHDGSEDFWWMADRGRIDFAPGAEQRFLELWVYSDFRDLSHELTVASADRSKRFQLVGGWAPLSMTIPAGADRAALAVNKIFPRAYHPDDERVLSVRLRRPRLHADPRRHASVSEQQANGVLNLAELLERRVRLESTPPSLGIDMYGVCNVKPPCVYCEWDLNKDLEGANVDAPFTRETLAEWGPFFDNAVGLVNCSIGEPFMMKNFDELLDIFGDRGKVLEMTTNGQILTDRNIQKLLGRRVDLYISLDAGTAQTYARLRNDTFDRIQSNLRRLIAAKGGRGGLPRIHLVFMPMRANVHELDDFVRLAAELGVDRMVLRPLNYSDSIDLDWTRRGYRFEYKRELLPFETLVRVSGRAAELCRQLGVPLADQMDFGGEMRTLFAKTFDAGRLEAAGQPQESSVAGAAAERDAGGDHAPDPPEVHAELGSADQSSPTPALGPEREPACLEPWKSLYILRRGVFPCCYGGEPLTEMTGYREAWNAPLIQAIRRDLLDGRFHDYCLRSAACPIVRKSQAAASLPIGQALQLRARQLWLRFDRATHGRFRNPTWPLRWLAIRVARAASDPAYVRHHLRRLSGRRPR